MYNRILARKGRHANQQAVVRSRPRFSPRFDLLEDRTVMNPVFSTSVAD